MDGEGRGARVATGGCRGNGGSDRWRPGGTQIWPRQSLGAPQTGTDFPDPSSQGPGAPGLPHRGHDEDPAAARDRGGIGVLQSQRLTSRRDKRTISFGFDPDTYWQILARDTPMDEASITQYITDTFDGV